MGPGGHITLTTTWASKQYRAPGLSAEGGNASVGRGVAAWVLDRLDISQEVLGEIWCVKRIIGPGYVISYKIFSRAMLETTAATVFSVTHLFHVLVPIPKFRSLEARLQRIRDWAALFHSAGVRVDRWLGWLSSRRRTGRRTGGGPTGPRAQFRASNHAL